MIRKNYRKLPYICAFVLSVVLCGAALSFILSSGKPASLSPSQTVLSVNPKPWKVIISDNISLDGPYLVDRVIDGDTIVILMNNEKVRVRLLGIDCPESVSPDEDKNSEEGILASDFTHNILSSCEVYLEYDEELYDSYDRLLAYVYYIDRDSDLIMFNRQLLYEGHAAPILFEPNDKYYEEFCKIYNSLG